MRKSPCSLQKSPARRRGFTLIEVLMVIAILSILAAFLVPAVMRAMGAGKLVQVKTEMSQLSTAIQTFRTDFGSEPPSRIILHEASGKTSSPTALNWTNTDSLTTSSKAILTRLWPQIVFGGYNSGSNTDSWDFNNDGDSTDTFTINGAECLVFFMGGVADSNGQLIGFSRNPADPFSRSGTNRQGPFYTNFTSNRLIPVTANNKNSQFFGFADPISGAQMPYLYISSNEGQGYSNADLDNSIAKMTAFPTIDAMTQIYLQGTTTSSPAWNKNSYQLICAGADRKFGTGGPYTKENGPIQLTVARDVERDNITNFSDGVLAP